STRPRRTARSSERPPRSAPGSSRWSSAWCAPGSASVRCSRCAPRTLTSRLPAARPFAWRARARLIAPARAVDGNSDLYIGTAAFSEGDYIHDAIAQADLILAIGHDVVEKPPFLMGPRGPHVIHFSCVPASVEDIYFPQHEVIGDLGHGLALLGERLRGN